MDQPSSVSPADAIVPQQGSSPSHRGDLMAMLVSAVVHLLLLMLLALWVLPSLAGGGTETLVVSVDESQSFALESVDLSSDIDLAAEASSDAPVEVARLFEVPELELERLDSDEDSGTSAAMASFVPAKISEQSLSTSNSVEGAVDRVTAELQTKLEKGDLLVVWMLDASNSLVDDRQRVAARLTPFYEDLVTRRSVEKHQLVSAVVSFGNTMRERVAPTEFGEPIVAAVESLPVDRSGNEKVFEAVAKCAEHYRQSWRDGQLAIVIWTDESGDDIQNLEQTIKVCREQKVSVSVVGPSSVLGADTGLHSYLDPDSQSTYQIPVKRGPESAMPERIELGYWYLTRFQRGGRRGQGESRGQGRPRGGQGRPRGGQGRPRGGLGQLPAWLGGQDLEGIVSGFSPYALTRLTIQTGGSYTIFDRPEDRGPFNLVSMNRYAPSYSSYAHYVQQFRSHPLRDAVMKAVAQLEGKKIDAPPTMLFIKTTGPRIFDFMRFYYPPLEFQAKLRSSRGRLTGQAARYTRVVEAALRHVSADESLDVGLEDLHRYETSPRWRAWYDLTRGRLLATSVRLEEYRLTVNAIAKAGALASTTNHLILVASPELRSDEKFQRRAEEAERLLRRCVDEHRGTPWEVLAQRDLDFALGVGMRELALTQEPAGPAVRQPNLPRF
jgi:hypothetical protein